MGKFFSIVRKAVRDFGDDDCMSSAAAMAYYAIFSLPPLFALVVAIAGAFGIEREHLQTLVQNQWGVTTSGGQESSDGKAGDDDSKKTAERNLPDRNGIWGIAARIIGGVILVLSATGLFAQLQYTLNRAWEVKPDPKRGGVLAFLGKRVLSLGMILVVVFLLLVSMLLTTVIDEIIAYLKGGGADPTTIVLRITLNSVVTYVVATLLFAAMFKVLPDAEIAWRDVWFGAIVTGLLFVVGKTLIALYLQNSDTASGWGDAAAALIGVLVWMYYSSIIVLFGAELTQAWATEHGRAIEPSAGAIPAGAK